MRYLILPISKNPAFGRLGPKKFQDWYRSCKKAVELEQRLNHEGYQVEIVIASAVQVIGFRDETSIYFDTLRELGVARIRKVGQSYETIGEIETALNVAKQERAELIFISTFGHYLRTTWLIRGSGAQHFGVFGLPRFKELMTDVILTVAFPIIDVLGGRLWFQKKVIQRRQAGRH